MTEGTIATPFGRIKDTRIAFAALTKYPNAISIADVQVWTAATASPVTDEAVVRLAKTFEELVMSLVSVATGYDCCHADRTATPVGSLVRLGREFDHIFDIKISGATYGYLWIEHATAVSQSCMHQRFDMIQNENDEFTFPEVDIDNPLHTPAKGGQFYFYTDGTSVSYKGGIIRQRIDGEPWKMHQTSNDEYLVNFLRDHVLLTGRTWTIPSFSYRSEHKPCL